MNRAAVIKTVSVSAIRLMVIIFSHLFARKSHDSSGGPMNEVSSEFGK
jgi:hypothetical protein